MDEWDSGSDDGIIDEEQMYEEDKKYCECCGKTISYLKKRILEQKFGKLKSFNRHFLYNNLFFNEGEIKFCSNCGKRLSPENFKTDESILKLIKANVKKIIVLGYHCKECGYKVDFTKEEL